MRTLCRISRNPSHAKRYGVSEKNYFGLDIDERDFGSLKGYWHALACAEAIPEDQGVVPVSFIAALTPDLVALNMTYQRIAIGIRAEAITNRIPKGAKCKEVTESP
jgi:hypothetical protein